MQKNNKKETEQCTSHAVQQRFEVATYTIEEGNKMGYCHWSEGLNMIIIKDDVTLKLNSEEIQKVVASLPRTLGGTY